MAGVVVSLTIPEADVADAKAAAEAFTGLVIQRNEKNEVTFTPSAKELLAALANVVVTKYRHEQAAIAKPGVN